MSYSCAENVAQLSRARDGLSILRECRKKKNVNSPTKAVRGLKLQSKQIRCPACTAVYHLKSGKP